ncbi:MAG TPA: hypothetical protein QF604_22165 [Candidatus Latescibacteria bacterium]|nr:hypothetical protein [Candidatus Latescibacterota bacterium]HJN30621.1 hypothetical protein [Candidatus Latescibacterota bacterium]
MRQRRTIYFNDARHYYLFVYDPPMRMEDAWSPIDEVSGTSVDTFSYGVSRADGLFYPSKVGLQWGSDRMPFQNAYEWRCWENMQSLTARGLDPLQVLIDRAHEKNMDFIASLRLGEYGGMDPDHSVGNGGRGFVHSEVRDHQRSVVEELATAYNTEAVELDFSAAPGGCAHCLNPDEAPAQASVLTDFVRDCATAVRGRSGDAGLLGARVYPSPDLNQRAGLDVDTWLNEGLVDFLIPSSYSCFFLDSQMPIDWIVEAAHRQDTSVYGILQPYYLDGSRINTNIEHMSTEKMRAAAANFWQADVDGLCTWFMDWPLEQVQRQILTELGDPDLTREGTKHYFLRQRAENPARFVYDAELPVAIKADADKTHEISFTICDDPANERIGRIRLKINVADLVPADVFDVRLNGVCLASEPCRRYPRWHDAYIGTWMEFELNTVRPVRGTNTLQFALRERPASLEGEISIDDVELIVEYDLYAAQNETAREGAVT